MRPARSRLDLSPAAARLPFDVLPRSFDLCAELRPHPLDRAGEVVRELRARRAGRGVELAAKFGGKGVDSLAHRRVELAAQPLARGVHALGDGLLRALRRRGARGLGVAVKLGRRPCPELYGQAPEALGDATLDRLGEAALKLGPQLRELRGDGGVARLRRSRARRDRARLACLGARALTQLVDAPREAGLDLGTGTDEARNNLVPEVILRGTQRLLQMGLDLGAELPRGFAGLLTSRLDRALRALLSARL